MFKVQFANSARASAGVGASDTQYHTVICTGRTSITQSYSKAAQEQLSYISEDERWWWKSAN